jgi:hypothetical protein
MLETQSSQKNTELWNQLISQESAYKTTRQTFLRECHNRREIIQQALGNPVERATALKLFVYLTEEERQNLFNELVQLASVGHSDIELVRQIILSFPKKWLLTHIEKSAEPLLNKGTDEEYRRLLELYIELDLELAKRLAARALQQNNPNIRETGEDFEDYLDKHYMEG